MSILKVGFGREKITPTMEVYISGGGNPKRRSTGILDDLYITCVAITDLKDNTVLVFTEDMQQVSSPFIDPGVEGVVAATGVAQENILIAATHTHSAPGQHLGRHGIQEFQQIYTKGMPQAAVTAMAALAFGDVAMTFGAFEMFGDTGVDIREKSHYDTTFVVSQSLSTNDYIPAPIGFKLRCYEAYSSHYAPGTAERITEEYVRVLKA